MGVSEVQELMRREEEKERKRRARRERRTERRERASAVLRSASEAIRFRRRLSGKTQKVEPQESFEMLKRPISNAAASEKEDCDTVSQVSTPTQSARVEISSSGSGVLYSLRQTSLGHLLQGWYRRLCRAHLTAAHEQAIDQVNRRQQVYNRSDGSNTSGGGAAPGDALGWGLGSFGIRERERADMSDDRDDMQDMLVRIDSSQLSVASRVGSGPRTQSLGLGERRLPPPSKSWSPFWWGPLRRWRLQDATAY